MYSCVALKIILSILCPSVVFADILQLPFLKDQNDSSSFIQSISVPVDRNSSKNQNSSIALPEESAQLQNATDSLPGPWVSDMFYQALSNFTVHDDVGTTACQKETQLYIRHLKNNSYWAVKSKNNVHRIHVTS